MLSLSLCCIFHGWPEKDLEMHQTINELPWAGEIEVAGVDVY